LPVSIKAMRLPVKERELGSIPRLAANSATDATSVAAKLSPW